MIQATRSRSLSSTLFGTPNSTTANVTVVTVNFTIRDYKSWAAITGHNEHDTAFRLCALRPRRVHSYVPRHSSS